jgi:hypothetical protein
VAVRIAEIRATTAPASAHRHATVVRSARTASIVSICFVKSIATSSISARGRPPCWPRRASDRRCLLEGLGEHDGHRVLRVRQGRA